MRAYVLRGIGDMELMVRPVPEPGPGEALVRVMAAGICGSDIPRIFETGAHKMPLVPGHEFAGLVAGTGKGVDQTLIGRRVGVFPLIPCGECDQCRRGQYQRCVNYDYTGSRRDGAFADHVAVPAANLLQIGDDIPFEAAAMLEPMAVAVHAMRRGLELSMADGAVQGADVRAYLSDKRVAVMGLGTIGLLLCMFLRDAGAGRLYLIGNRESQRVRAAGLGFGPGIVYCGGDPAKWLTGTAGGADIFFECVGRQEALNTMIPCIAPGGTGVIVGNPHGDMAMPRDVYWKILRNELKLTGTWNSIYNGTAGDDWHYALDRVRTGGVEPQALITHRISLEELGRGLGIMRDKTEDYCKIMVMN